MVFDYSVQKTFNQSIDIVDMGNTALRCLNRSNDAYYMIIKTTFGKTSIFRFGPVCQDLDMLLDDFFVNYKKIPYKEASIYKEIDKFINDFKKEITEVEEVTELEAWEDFPQLKQQFEDT